MNLKKIKKVLGIVITCLMVFPVMVQAAEAEAVQHHTIAVAIPDYSTAQMIMFKSIYENQIADAFDVEFIFSEGLNNDIAAEMQFMENAKNSGAEGYISFNISTVEHAQTIAAKANDMQLYTALNGIIDEAVNSMPYLAGAVDASAAIDTISEQFGELTDILVGDGELHNVAICTMGASVGSVQHVQSTIAALESLQAIYGLSFDRDLEEIAKTQNVTEYATGTDVRITIIPGPTPMVAADVEQVLKGGDYDVLICVGPQYSWYESVIKSVEDNLKIDVKTCSIMGISEATATSFNTLDATGHNSLNCALLKNATVADQLFVLVENALEGNADVYKADGAAQLYPNLMWLCDGPDSYDSLSQVDSTQELAAYSTEELLEMIGNADQTADSFRTWCEEATAENILTKLNLK